MYVGVHEADQLNSSLNCDEGGKIYNITVFNMAAVDVSVWKCVCVVPQSWYFHQSNSVTAVVTQPLSLMLTWCFTSTREQRLASPKLLKKIPLTSL